MSLQSECCVQRGHDGRGSEESEEHEGRYGRHGDPTAAETHLQSALLPGSSSTGTAHPYRFLQEDKQRSCFKFQVSSFICHIHDYTETV